MNVVMLQKKAHGISLPFMPRPRMKDIKPEYKKGLGIYDANRSQSDFLDSEWWYDAYRQGRQYMTDEYMKRHENWWKIVLRLGITKTEDRRHYYISVYSADSGRTNVYFRESPYQVETKG